MRRLWREHRFGARGRQTGITRVRSKRRKFRVVGGRLAVLGEKLLQGLPKELVEVKPHPLILLP